MPVILALQRLRLEVTRAQELETSLCNIARLHQKKKKGDKPGVAVQAYKLLLGAWGRRTKSSRPAWAT
jgi:hypothetical protein